MSIACWAKADYIVEGEYTTGAQEQLYIENNGVIAAFDRGAGGHGVGLAAVSLLCAQGADGACAICPQTKFVWCRLKREARSAAKKIIPR